MKHRALIHFLLIVWGLCACRLVYAATFAQEVRGFDYESLLTGAVGGLCGGALRTIFTLANDERAVFKVLKEAYKDLVVSFMAGGAAYLLLILIDSKFPGFITRELRFVGVLAAGWTRHAIFVEIGKLMRARLDRVEKDVGKGKLDPPASAPVKLGK